MKSKAPKPHSTTIRFFIHSLMVNSLVILLPLLLVSLYSIFRTTSESTRQAQVRASRILSQADGILEGFYTHVDNAYLFFSSNPKASSQIKKAFSEPSLSLDSLRSVENLSLNFQNLIYTDNYLENIYIYYQNPYHRIFVPLSSKMIAFPEEREAELLDACQSSGAEDVWMEFTDTPVLYTEYPTPSLFIYRKLYRRTTNVQEGVVFFSFHADRLLGELSSLLEYENQQIFLVDSKNGLVWPSSQHFSEEELLALCQEMDASGASPSLDFQGHTATFFKGPRSYGFSYLLLTPKDQIYQTTISLTSMYIVITLLAIAMACALAYFKTRRDYKYLSQIISAFSSSDFSQLKETPPAVRGSDPFEYILMNVIHLFIQQDYLKLQDSEKTVKLQLSELQALQHQINPHFLHNTLNTIYWESVKLTGTENQCSRMISQLAAIMRHSLSSSQETITIQSEIVYLKQYLEIMKVRYADRFDTDFRIAPDCSGLLIKKMLIQPIVENAIYHGIKEKPGKGLIRVQVHQKKGRVYFSCYDTGLGIPQKDLADLRLRLSQSPSAASQHIGLLNTNSRLVLTYGPEAGLHINSHYRRFTAVWFSIPAQEERDG